MQKYAIQFKVTKIRARFKNSLPQHNIKMILKSTNRLSSLFRFEDVFSKEPQPHLVYKFSCGNCNITYNGKTERHLNVRSGEHFGVSHLTEKRVECEPSASSDYLLLHNHDNDFLSYVEITIVPDFY